MYCVSSGRGYIYRTDHASSQETDRSGFEVRSLSEAMYTNSMWNRILWIIMSTHDREFDMWV